MTSPGAKILLIDDDPVIQRGYGQRLRAEAWDVHVASDGYEALTAAASKAWDLILLDLRIPYRNGIEVLRILRQRRETQATTIYVLAQPGDADLVDRAMREGADGFFEKAKLGPRDITAEIGKILDAARERGSAVVPPAASADAVPAAVDEIARRFRKPDSTVRPAAHTQTGSPSATTGWSAGPNVRPGTPAAPGRTMTPGQETTLPPYGILDEDDDLSPTVGPAASVAPAQSANPRSAHQATQPAAAQPRPVPVASPAAARGPANAPAPASTDVAAYDTMLNRMVGQSAQLAQALGLPSDFTCPVCRSQLVLRLAPDTAGENAVYGHFYCPRCASGG